MDESRLFVLFYKQTPLLYIRSHFLVMQAINILILSVVFDWVGKLFNRYFICDTRDETSSPLLQLKRKSRLGLHVVFSTPCFYNFPHVSMFLNVWKEL